MKTQQFPDSHIQLVFLLWGLWTHKVLKNSHMSRMDFFLPNISAFWSKSRKINQKNFEGKMQLKMKHLSLFLLFVTDCQNFKIVKIHFDPKLVLVFPFFFFKSKLITVNF